MKRWWPTVPEIADDVREALASGDDIQAIRMLMDGINALPAALHAGVLDDALGEPDTTGDERWDALLAGALRFRLHQMGATAPAWTYKQPLTKAWWPFAYSPSDAYNDMAHTPAELMRLGIFLDEREFSQA